MFIVIHSFTQKISIDCLELSILHVSNTAVHIGDSKIILQGIDLAFEYFIFILKIQQII